MSLRRDVCLSIEKLRLVANCKVIRIINITANSSQTKRPVPNMTPLPDNRPITHRAAIQLAQWPLCLLKTATHRTIEVIVWFSFAKARHPSRLHQPWLKGREFLSFFFKQSNYSDCLHWKTTRFDRLSGRRRLLNEGNAFNLFLFLAEDMTVKEWQRQERHVNEVKRQTGKRGKDQMDLIHILHDSFETESWPS